LLMEPLPSVSKACLMIERIEQQRQVTRGVTHAREIAAVASKGNFTSPNAFLAKGSNAQGFKKDSKKSKSARFCDHCQRTGHTIDQCFKLIGYPDWYDASKDKGRGRGGPKVAAHVLTQNTEQMQEDPLEDSSLVNTGVNTQFDTSLVQALAQEMMKFMKGKQGEQQHDHLQSFAHFAGSLSTGFSSISSHSDTSCAVQHSYSNSWIVDTGASDHMTSDLI